MKKLIPVFSLLSCVAVNAQVKDVRLEWSEQNYVVSTGESFFIPTFQTENFSYNSGEKLIKARVFINNTQGNQLKVVSYKTQPIDLTKYKDINIKDVPVEINPTISTYTTSGVQSAIVYFNPIIKTSNGYSKITDIVLEVYGSKPLAKAANLTVQNSVLATGNWFKFKVDETGVYRLDKNFLNKLGVPSDVDPRTVKIYGFGGDMLPLSNDKNSVFDLPEVAIQFVGENDGVLNDGDHALFYAVGTKGWNEENVTHHNLYSKDAYYYVTYGGSNGKRMSLYNQPSGTPSINYTDYETRVFHEQNIDNITQLGRKTFGEDFGKSFSFATELKTPLINSNKPVKIGINVAAISQTTTYFNINLNNQQIGSRSVNSISSNVTAQEAYFSHEMNLNTESNLFNITFNNNGVPSSKGYIDFIAIDYNKYLAGYNKQFKFNFKDAQIQVGVGSFTINNAQSITQVWDVTDRYNPTYSPNSSSTINLNIPLGELRDFVAVDQNDIYNPIEVSSSKISNQNLKGTILANGPVDYIIITNNDLKSAADRLASLHTTKSNLNVRVVTLDAIYNEFSSGQQDIVAIRNFIRYVYFAGNQTLKYVNLFGDASTNYFDPASNVVPIFHYLQNNLQGYSGGNFNDWSTFATDDFYALLDDNEGEMKSDSYRGIDVAIGRMPVTNLREANAMVSKVEQYLSADNTGRWKNVYTALADDVDGTSDAGLQVALNQMVDELVDNKPYFNIKKVIADSYQQQVVAGGPRYPKAKEDFINGINSGSLVVNYLGHGSETGLGGERYFEIPDIDKLTNENKYALFGIMTCDFTRFDNPKLKSGGEYLFLKEKAGAIGILATTRKIGITSANEFTKNVSRWLFDYNNNLPHVTMAEALMRTKNDTEFIVAEQGMIAYIGDPALKLAVPKPNIVISHINDQPIAEFTGSLRALDKVKMKGQVTTQSGSLISNFNGDLAIQLFDKNQDKETLVNDGVGEPMKFKTLGETIFRGNASVTNGEFQFEFVVPKDIKIAVGEGKASFYAVKDSNILDDYTGADTTIKVGGVNENAAEDNKAPELKLYMNDETFISGGITNNSPLFLVHLQDENGMNTASGIGHDMVAILDGDENNPFVLNEYYETEPDNYTKGFINYPFKNLKEGLHTITFKGWDVYNNLATATLDFVVAADTGLQIDKLLNYPNPFVDYTEFWFHHNRPNQTLEAQIQILTVTGKIVKTINQTIVTDGVLSRDIKWDGRDDFGDKIGKGVYIYRLKLKSNVSGEQTEKFEKLVIL